MLTYPFSSLQNESRTISVRPSIIKTANKICKRDRGQRKIENMGWPGSGEIAFRALQYSQVPRHLIVSEILRHKQFTKFRIFRNTV